MSSSLSRNGGLTLFVTHMKIIAFMPVFFILKTKKSKIKKVYPDSNPGPSEV